MGSLYASLVKVFPADNFALLVVILLLPLLGAIVNGVFGKRLGKEGVTLMALMGVGGSFIASVVTFFMLAQAQGMKARQIRGRGQFIQVEAERQSQGSQSRESLCLENDSESGCVQPITS